MNSDTTMGEFILALRKEQNLTQKELAQKIHVTDKAVSKWERGLGNPDITIITELAQALGVSASELLEGKRSEDQQTRQVVDKTILYASKLKLKQFHFSLKLARWVTGIVCIITILTCSICNLAIEGKFTWSGIVIAGTVFFGAVALVCLWGKQRWWVYGLAAATVLLLPLLLAIEHFSWNYVSPLQVSPWLWTIAVPISAVSLAYLWAVCLVWTYNRWNWLFKTGISIAIAPLVELGTLLVLHGVGI